MLLQRYTKAKTYTFLSRYSSYMTASYPLFIPAHLINVINVHGVTKCSKWGYLGVDKGNGPNVQRTSSMTAWLTPATKCKPLRMSETNLFQFPNFSSGILFTFGETLEK